MDFTPSPVSPSREQGFVFLWASNRPDLNSEETFTTSSVINGLQRNPTFMLGQNFYIVICLFCLVTVELTASRSLLLSTLFFDN